MISTHALQVGFLSPPLFVNDRRRFHNKTIVLKKNENDPSLIINSAQIPDFLLFCIFSSLFLKYYCLQGNPQRI